jgi:hypothetical protein
VAGALRGSVSPIKDQKKEKKSGSERLFTLFCHRRVRGKETKKFQCIRSVPGCAPPLSATGCFRVECCDSR